MSVKSKQSVTCFHSFCKHGFEQKGQRTSQKKGTACFDMGLNFPEKHANYIYNVLFFQQKYFSSISLV